jgi:hypothetical protein
MIRVVSRVGGLGGFVRWINSRVYEGSDVGVCEGVGCPSAAHDYGHDVHLSASRMRGGPILEVLP